MGNFFANTVGYWEDKTHQEIFRPFSIGINVNNQHRNLLWKNCIQNQR